MLIKPIAQQDNIVINKQGVYAKTYLASRKLAKKEAKKAATAKKKAELMAVKKVDAVAAKLNKAKTAEKLAMKNKLLKAEANMKKS